MSTILCAIYVSTFVVHTLQFREYDVNSYEEAKMLAAIDAGRIAVEESGWIDIWSRSMSPNKPWIESGFTCRVGDGKEYWVDLGLDYPKEK